MSGISLEEFEKKMIETLKQKEENIYRRILEKLNMEERRANLQERAVRIEEELKGQRVLIEKLLHQFDKRFEQMHKDMESRYQQVDKRFEQMQGNMESRYQQVDKRFKQMQDNMETRFQQVDKRFSILTWALGAGFTFTISILVVVLNFILKM
jgi:hypothetical protein